MQNSSVNGYHADVGDAGTIVDLQVMVGELQHALANRIIIEQAKGAISAYRHVPVDNAFEMLRIFARGGNRNIHELAAEVVANGGRIGTDAKH